MPQQLIPILIVVGALALLLLGVVIIVAKFYVKVDQGKALIVNTMKSEPLVTFTGAVVYPIIHRAEVMDISVKTIEIDRRGKEGLICKDNIRADIKVTFFVRVNKTQDDVLKVAQSIGCGRASDPRTLEELFTAKFSEALKTVGKGLNFEDLYKERQKFKDDIIKVIGTDLNGFVLDDAAIDYLEQTPLDHLDKDNIMDAEGIRKITDLTVAQNVQTNELRQKERMELGSQNLAADEAVFRFEQRRAEAEAKKAKEIAVAKAREENEAHRIAGEERKKTILAQQKNEEEEQVATENKSRSVAVAQKNREREVGVEEERVVKAKQLEALGREREVEIQRIAKEKEVELKKKEIADVIRSRVAVDKTVAEEEERIKDVRALAEANRTKEVVRISAEAEAQEQLVKQIKAAEASEEVAKYQSRQKLVLADADLEASDKQTRAKIRLAEGVQAEVAAEGLAKVRVREADAAALEKQGLVEARVTLEKMQAEAAGEEKKGISRARVREAEAAALEKQGLAEVTVSREKAVVEASGIEQQGLAHVKVREAEAAAIEKQGAAEAAAAREKLLAEAAGEEQKGLAVARVREAEALAIGKRGEAEANATKLKLLAEAAGLSEKAVSMKALDEASRVHEEFRLRLEKEKAVELESIHARTAIAEAQAKVLAEAFSHAKIQIVGGDGQFFDRFVKAVGVGQSLDGVVEHSAAVRGVMGDYISGQKSLPEDIKQILMNPALSSESVQSLTISAILGRLLLGADEPAKKQIKALIDKAKELGIDDLTAH